MGEQGFLRFGQSRRRGTRGIWLHIGKRLPAAADGYGRPFQPEGSSAGRTTGDKPTSMFTAGRQRTQRPCQVFVRSGVLPQTGRADAELPSRKVLERGLRITERWFCGEHESRRKAVDGHAQQHLRGPPKERSQNVQNWTGAENIDVGLNLADVGNQSTQAVWSLVAHGSRGAAHQAHQRLSRQRDNAGGQGGGLENSDRHRSS